MDQQAHDDLNGTSGERDLPVLCRNCGAQVEQIENYERINGLWQRVDVWVHPAQIDGTTPNLRGIHCDSTCNYEAEPIL